MSKILKILTVPEKSLRKKSKEIRLSEIKGLGKFSADMIKTMLESDGVGLAAPQVGRNIRLIVVNTKNGVVCMFNPVIGKKSLLQEWGEEGCLSVPEIFGNVKRHKRINLAYIDSDGKEIKLEAKGFLARVIQHEIDHLDGVLFIDKAKDLERIVND